MRFLVTRSVVNPAGKVFEVNGAHPAALQAGDIVTFGAGDDPDFNNDDQELLRLSQCYLALPTALNIALVNAQIEAEALMWASRMDKEASGGSSFHGFRTHRKPTPGESSPKKSP
jgi:hypothetical protein